MIVRKIPNVLPKFEDMLDHAITLAEHDINDVDCELKMDFKVLIPNQVKRKCLDRGLRAGLLVFESSV